VEAQNTRVGPVRQRSVTAPLALDRSPAVHEELGFFRGLVQGMRCGIVCVDPDGRVIMVNAPAREILGLEHGASVGLPIEGAFADHPRLVQVLREAFAMTSLPNRAELELGQGPGSSRSIGFTLSVIRDSDGAAKGIAVFFKDLTQIEHKEEQERLKDRLAALGQMAANMAHEIRNPLASIEVTCTLLKRRMESDASARELLDKIVTEVRRLDKSVHTSLDFVRPITLTASPEDLSALLEDAIQVCEGRRGGPGITILRRFDPTLPRILMDAGLMRQVFVNLILNAMEAVEGRGTVAVATTVVAAPSGMSVPYVPGQAAELDSWKSFERCAVVTISDTGPGIRPEHRDRLFHPFFTTKPSGSGVGLSLAKKIVGSHRGVIDVDNHPGAGAVFTVRLPVVAEPAED
jgi:PAS domain S-box-containing protein